MTELTVSSEMSPAIVEKRFATPVVVGVACGGPAIGCAKLSAHSSAEQVTGFCSPGFAGSRGAGCAAGALALVRWLQVWRLDLLLSC